jgi:hypothetical protein
MRGDTHASLHPASNLSERATGAIAPRKFHPRNYDPKKFAPPISRTQSAYLPQQLKRNADPPQARRRGRRWKSWVGAQSTRHRAAGQAMDTLALRRVAAAASIPMPAADRATETKAGRSRREVVPLRDRCWVSVNEAVQVTGEGRTKIYEHIALGKLLTKKTGRRRLINVRSLLEYCGE